MNIFVKHIKAIPSTFAHLQTFSLKFSSWQSFVIRVNLLHPSPSLNRILVPLWFITISLVFFYLSKLIFSGFLIYKSYFV